MLLNKNLNFCPRPRKYNKNVLNNELSSFYRRIKLKAHFKNKNESKQNTFYLKSTSTWTPSKVSPCVETFIQAVNNNITEAEEKQVKKDNLTKEERLALKDLENRDDVIFTKADKGGAVVIWDTQDYINEATRQLNDVTSYKKLDEDPTIVHEFKVTETIEELSQR